MPDLGGIETSRLLRGIQDRTGTVLIARANHRISYPARIQLVAAMNPCRCGHAGDPGFACRRGDRCAADYQERITGPLIDRIDLRVEVGAVTAADLVLPAPSEGSAEVAARVLRARRIQAERYAALKVDGPGTNATCPAGVVEQVAALDGAGQKLLAQAAEALRLSARGYHRVLKVARTLADLEGDSRVGRVHLAEALAYRGAGERLAAAA